MKNRDANDTSEGPESTKVPRPDFFISYAPADEAWAVWIAGQLEYAGYHVFVHAWDLRPGHNIILTINKALLYHPRVLLLVSPHLPQADLPQAEWAATLFQDLTGERQALVPVRVAPCKVGGLLAPLYPLDLFDLSEQDALDRLLVGLTTENVRRTGPLPGAGSLTGLFFPGIQRPHRHRIFQAPDLPTSYVPRLAAYGEIKRHLLAQLGGQTTSITTALRGAGGFGKTTLASALCHDPEIQGAFPDGILWKELGERPPEPLMVINELLQVLEPSEREALTLEEARERWRNVLEEHIYLLVIDDVWQTSVLKELLQGGPQCGRLITTRNDQILPDEARKVWVDAMEPGEAMALLCEGVIDEWQHTLDPSVLEQVVVHQLGCWPLLVSLARGMLTNQVGRLRKTSRQALARLQHAYEERGMATFHLRDRDERQRNVDACLEVNLRQLEEWVPTHYQARQRYLELAVFPEDTDISLSTLQIYWKGTGGLHEEEVEEMCLHLADLSLLLPRGTEQPTIRLHDVLRSYLIQCAGEQMPALHQCLLDAHQQYYHLIRWVDLPQSETYLWQHLIFHLRQGGHQEAIQTTITDPSFLMRKALYVGVSALEADLLLSRTTLSTRSEGQEWVQSISAPLHRNIVRISHLLRQAQTEAEMGGLLLSRLDEKFVSAKQRFALENELPRPFLTAWLSLPDRASSTLLRTLIGHTSAANGCAVSADGSVIVSASSDCTLKVWDASSGAELCTLTGHTSTVNGCAISADGSMIVSVSEDHTLKVWDASSESERLSLSSHTSTFNGCAVSADGSVIVSVSSDCTLKVWDASSGAELCTLTGHTSAANGCAISADGSVIVSACYDGTLKVWDASSGAELRTLTGHASTVNGCAVSADGSVIVSASHDWTLKVWDALSGTERLTLTGHEGPVLSCAVSADGSVIVSASVDDTLTIWDASSGERLLIFPGHTSQVNGCAVSADGCVAISASLDETLKVWDASSGFKYLTFGGNSSWISKYEVGEDGHMIVSASSSKILKMWRATFGSGHSSLSRQLGNVTIANNVGGYVPPTATSCAVSADGSVMVSAHYRGLKVWHATSGTEIFTLSEGKFIGNSCAISAKSSWIVAARSGTLKIWRFPFDIEYLTLSGHKSIQSCAISADGSFIVGALWDHTLKVWDTATGVKRLTLRGHAEAVNSCAVSADGSFIVSTSHDNTLKIWDAVTGTEHLTLRGHTRWPACCAISADGSFIVSASYDETLKVWDTSTGIELRTLSGHTDWVTGCAISTDGRFIVSVSHDNTLKIWDASYGICLLTFPVEGSLYDCAFYPDGEHLVACGDHGMYFLRLVK